jgi:hypothetical protein
LVIPKNPNHRRQGGESLRIPVIRCIVDDDDFGLEPNPLYLSKARSNTLGQKDGLIMRQDTYRKIQTRLQHFAELNRREFRDLTQIRIKRDKLLQAFFIK